MPLIVTLEKTTQANPQGKIVPTTARGYGVLRVTQSLPIRWVMRHRTVYVGIVLPKTHGKRLTLRYL